MIRQYYAQRRRGGLNPLGVGVIPVGAVFYLQDEGWWRDRYRGAPVCRNPWVVEAFLNGTIGAARRNRETGLWEDIYAAGRSDLAVVRSLRDGRRRTVAVRILILHEEHGLAVEPCGYPDLPDLRLWRVSSHRKQADDRIAESEKPREKKEGRREKGKRLPHRRPPPQGSAATRRSGFAGCALAPAERDAARGRGLPEEQGG